MQGSKVIGRPGAELSFEEEPVPRDMFGDVVEPSIKVGSQELVYGPAVDHRAHGDHRRGGHHSADGGRRAADAAVDDGVRRGAAAAAPAAASAAAAAAAAAPQPKPV